MSLAGHSVDIVTSSDVLAKRDWEHLKEFYSTFGLTADHNCTNTPGRKFWFKKDIVYGDVKNFQWDYLKDTFKQEKTRWMREYDYVIIDEVDNMLLDNAQPHHYAFWPISGAWRSWRFILKNMVCIYRFPRKVCKEWWQNLLE